MVASQQVFEGYFEYLFAGNDEKRLPYQVNFS
jgi:hypothetical protein